LTPATSRFHQSHPLWGGSPNKEQIIANTWIASGSHVVNADVDYRRRISNGGPGDVTVSAEGIKDSTLEPGQSIVAEKVSRVSGEGARVTIELDQPSAAIINDGSIDPKDASEKPATKKAASSKKGTSKKDEKKAAKSNEKSAVPSL